MTPEGKYNPQMLLLTQLYNQKCENVNTSDRKMCYYNKYSNRIKKDCRRKLEYENRISGRKNNRR